MTQHLKAAGYTLMFISMIIGWATVDYLLTKYIGDWAGLTVNALAFIGFVYYGALNFVGLGK